MLCPIDRDIEVLVEYCAGRLAPADAAEVQAHLAACPACRRFVDAQSAVWNDLDRLEPAAVSPDFDRKLWARIEREERRRWWAPPYWRPVLSLALAALLVIAAVIFERPKPAPPPGQAQVETIEADRLERALDDIEMLRQLDAAESQVM